MDNLRQLVSSDIPFARDDAHRLLPAMVACLIGFAALLLAIAMCLTNALSDQSHDAIGVLHIEVPATRADDKGVMENVTTTLKATPGVEDVTVLGTGDMEQLLKPWLGKDFTLKDVPVPVMVDVKTAVENQTTTVNVAALRAALTKIDANIRIEDRGPWVAHIAQASTLLQALVIFVALLLIACVIGMIILVARTNLKLHFKTVSLLHMFGATDEYILRQFQWNSAWLAGRGALVGVVFALLIFSVAVVLSIQWQSPVLPQVHFSLLHGVMFVMLPIMTALIALVATRFTVQSMLHHMR